jgi:NADPH2:quinone reductase
VIDHPQYRRMLFRRFGTPDMFEWDAIRPRALAPGEVLVQVRFIGVNYADIIARRGYYKWAGRPPICPGFEVSGEVIEVGPDVRIGIGTPVMAVTKFGGYTEALIVPQEHVFQLPVGMTLREAAAFPAVYITAYHSLVEVMRIRKGDDILVQAVAGGVGIAALQIAKHYGLTVYGTASSDAKLDYAKLFGLDHGINYLREDFEAAVQRLTGGKGVKFVLDSLGGYGLRKGVRCLQPGGHVVTIGAAQIIPPVQFRLGEWARIIADCCVAAFSIRFISWSKTVASLAYRSYCFGINCPICTASSSVCSQCTAKGQLSLRFPRSSHLETSPPPTV